MNKASKLMAMFAGLALLSACGGGTQGQSGAQEEQGDLAGAAIGGPFTLTDQDGKTVHWRDFKGQYRLVYFGYTYCPDVCPLDLNKIMAGFRLLEKNDPAKAAKIQPMFITVDPLRDTPAILKSYVSAFNPRLIGLTGPVAEIAKVKKEFVVVASKEGDPKATQDYLVSHTRTPYLFDPDGKPIALVPVSNSPYQADGNGASQSNQSQPDDGSPQAVEAFLEKWVK